MIDNVEDVFSGFLQRIFCLICFP